jgi:hypothetical protein
MSWMSSERGVRIMTNDNTNATDTPPTFPKSRPLVDLENEFAATLKNDLPNVIRRGELLIEIKKALDRGKWLPWLAEKFALSESTAQNYMNAARFAEKYPTVRDLKLDASALYRLAAKEHRLTSAQLKVVFEAAEDRWIGTRDINRLLVFTAPESSDSEGSRSDCGLQPGADQRGTEIDAMAEQEDDDGEGCGPEENEAHAPHSDAARIDDFDATMRVMLRYAVMPTGKFVNAACAPTVSVSDIETVGNFLRMLAKMMKERALPKAA